jgi:DNA (cytosine-5)-methyltransferase 1
MTSYNVLSLFSGIGGIDLGLQRVGMTIVGQVEIDSYCQRVLQKHWPEVSRHDDVHTTIEWWNSQARPTVDIVAGGFPCQPVSTAGKGRAQNDERWLWPAFVQIIRQLRPKYALLENVPGLLGRGAGTVFGDLAESGYDAQWDCLPAAAVGAPHIRDRWFAVAYITNWRQVRDYATQRNTRAELLSTGHSESFGCRQGRSGRPCSDGMADADGMARSTFKVFTKSRSIHYGAHARAGTNGHDWTTESTVDRVADGIPHRVDRLRGLGNAVVPQVAEWVGRLIIEFDKSSQDSPGEVT